MTRMVQHPLRQVLVLPSLAFRESLTIDGLVIACVHARLDPQRRCAHGACGGARGGRQRLDPGAFGRRDTRMVKHPLRQVLAISVNPLTGKTITLDVEASETIDNVNVKYLDVEASETIDNVNVKFLDVEATEKMEAG